MNSETDQPTDWWKLVKSAASAWIDDYAPSMGAALSYYTVFSMAPLLLIVISVAGLAFGADAARGQIFGELRGMLGDDAAKSIEGLLASVSEPTEGIIATLIGVGVMLLGATTVFGELQDALDRIWRAPARQQSGGLWGLVRARLLSFGMILGIAFLLMVSLTLGAVVSALGKWWGDVFGGWEVVAQLADLLVGFVLTTGVFAMIYKLMPRVHVHWKDVWLGAVVTALLFTFGKFLIGLYIGRSGIASGFGAAGSLVVVLVWVYYSAQIFLMGAEFTWVYARTFGSMRGLETPGAEHPSQPEAIPSRSASTSPGAKQAQAGVEPVPVTSDLPIAGPAPAPAPASPPSMLRIGVGALAAFVLGIVLPRLVHRAAPASGRSPRPTLSNRMSS